MGGTIENILRKHFRPSDKWAFVFCMLVFFHGEAQVKDSSDKKILELSFGQSLLFISDSKLQTIQTNQAIVVPTSAILFFVEFRPQKKIRVPVFLNVPTESKQFIVNGQLTNEPSKPVFGFGLEFKTFQLQLDKSSKLELEAGPLASFLATKNKSELFAPIIAGRIRLIRGENFVMYAGSTYSIGINSFGLVFGTGTMF